MASRAEQKAAARAAREAAHRELSAAQTRRLRLYWLGGLAVAVIVAIVIVFVAAGSGGSTKAGNYTARSGLSHAAALKYAEQELAGIPQHGITLGNPNAPVTITEWGDLVCSTCDAFALDSEIQIIGTLVKTGKAKLVYRGLRHRQLLRQPERVHGRSGGHQGGGPAEQGLGLHPARLRGAAGDDRRQGRRRRSPTSPRLRPEPRAQIPGLNLLKWSAALGSSSLASQVAADNRPASRWA